MTTLLFCFVMTIPSEPLAAGDHTRALRLDDRTREYLVHVPEAAAGTPRPVVLIFHGGGSTAKVMVTFSGLNEKSDEAGFIAVYPHGTGRVERAKTFNGGNCCGYAQRQGVDDVKFVAALLDDLATVIHYDKQRVYATGMSNGAIMSYRLASELSDRIAAIAPVAGPMGTETCRPTRAVPVCHFHGTDDEFAPFAGGRGKRSLTQTNFYSVDHSIKAWVKANGCRATPRITKLAPAHDDGTRVTRTEYAGNGKGAEVVLYTIEGGGHTWPGQPGTFRFLGTTTRNISANDVMWEFFQRHSLE